MTGAARLRIEVGRFEIVATGGEAWHRRLATADLFVLTNELFWGEVFIVANEVRLGGHCYVLDMVWGLFVAGQELNTKAKYVFRAADGVGDYTFRLRDKTVLISLDRGPKVAVDLAVLQAEAAATCRNLIRDLMQKYPPLEGNSAIRKIADQVRA